MTLSNTTTGATHEVQARGVVNAAGPWVKQLLDQAIHIPSAHAIKLVKGSHIVVPRVHDQPHAYILQNDDRRVVFIIPYEDRFSLIGTTDVALTSLENAERISPEETAYLLRAANRFLAQPIARQDIVWSYAGVRPLYDDGSDNPAEVTRDYVLKVDHDEGKLPVLSIFGGKITTYRRLAEHALEELKPFYPAMGAPWTHTGSLPGGDIESVAVCADELARHAPLLPFDLLRAMASRHGSRTAQVLNGAKNLSELGQTFGVGAHLLCEREIEFLIHHEWARTADDILWRRTKCGLHMQSAEREAAAAFIEKKVSAQTVTSEGTLLQ